jgi:hypothetical protein
MAPEIDPDRAWKPVARTDVVFRQVGEEWVLFDPESQRIHVLNLTAALVWSFCTGEHGVQDIDDRVRQAFRDVPDTAGAAEALHGFSESGLLLPR